VIGLVCFTLYFVIEVFNIADSFELLLGDIRHINHSNNFSSIVANTFTVAVAVAVAVGSFVLASCVVKG
jgi:hypothetical protein